MSFATKECKKIRHGEVRLKGFVLSFQMGEKNKHMYADGNDPTEIKKKKLDRKRIEKIELLKGCL